LPSINETWKSNSSVSKQMLVIGLTCVVFTDGQGGSTCETAPFLRRDSYIREANIWQRC